MAEGRPISQKASGRQDRDAAHRDELRRQPQPQSLARGFERAFDPLVVADGKELDEALLVETRRRGDVEARDHHEDEVGQPVEDGAADAGEARRHTAGRRIVHDLRQVVADRADAEMF